MHVPISQTFNISIKHQGCLDEFFSHEYTNSKLLFEQKYFNHNFLAVQHSNGSHGGCVHKGVLSTQLYRIVTIIKMLEEGLSTKVSNGTSRMLLRQEKGISLLHQ